MKPSVLCIAFGLLSIAACNAQSSPRGPEQVCHKACAARALQCSDAACARGCNLVLDRLVEREGDNVITCMAGAGPRCDDRAWATCAARIGPHADGGPPAPPPPSSAAEDEL